MNKGNGWSRRDFIKAAGVATGAALAAVSALPSEAEADTPAIDKLLEGVCDLHVHADPDVRPRSVDQYTMVQKARQMSYRALLFKSHDFITHDSAYLLRTMLPDIEVFGGLALNKTFGTTLNVHAVEMAFKLTGNYCRCIWMPTYQSAYEYKRAKSTDEGIAVLDKDKNILSEVIRIMELCAEHNCIFATGHSSSAESLLLAAKAKEIGLNRFVITHATQHPWKLSLTQAKEALEHGAYLEHCLLPYFRGKNALYDDARKLQQTTMEEFAQYIKLDPNHSFISTNLGQQMNPHPIDGMRFFIRSLLSVGVSQAEIDSVAKKVPEYLVGLA